MISLLINFLIFVYVIGVFGSAVAGLSLYGRYKPGKLRKTPVLILAFLIPGANYAIMWEAFKSYEAYKIVEEEGRIITFNNRKFSSNGKNFNI